MFRWKLSRCVRCKEADLNSTDPKLSDLGEGAGSSEDSSVDEYDKIFNQETYSTDPLEDMEDTDKGKDKDKDKGQDKDKDKAKDKGKNSDQTVDPNKGKDQDKGKDKTPTLESLATELAEVKKQNAELNKAARRAFYAERQHKKESEDKSKDDPILSDAEIKSIIKEHKDDPEVLFNAILYKVQQMAKTGTKAAVDSVEIKGRQEKLTEVLRTRIGEEFDDEASEPRQAIVKVKSIMNLDDHPYGDFLAYGATLVDLLPQLAKKWYEKGKAEALGDSANDDRRQGIEDSQLTPKGNDKPSKAKDGELTASELETAKRMGLDRNPKKMKIYKEQILLRNRKSANR